jgi:hypothetical protein
MTAISPVWKIDTTGQHVAKGATPLRIMEAWCGIIPHFLKADDPSPCRVQMERRYRFPLYEIEGGTVDAQGVYHYPGDDPLPPLMSCDLRDETVHIYQHAIVAIRDPKGQWYVTRMD